MEMPKQIFFSKAVYLSAKGFLRSVMFGDLADISALI